MTKHASRDKQIAPQRITALGQADKRSLASEFDNAAQTVLLEINGAPHENAKMMLTNKFGAANPDDAMSSLLKFHQAILMSLLPSAPERRLRLSSTKVHRFYSLMYHLLDQFGTNAGKYDALLTQYREAIKDTFTALDLGQPLSKEELLPHMAEILATTSPELGMKRHR